MCYLYIFSSDDKFNQIYIIIFYDIIFDTILDDIFNIIYNTITDCHRCPSIIILNVIFTMVIFMSLSFKMFIFNPSSLSLIDINYKIVIESNLDFLS